MFEEVAKLKKLIGSVNTVVSLLRTDEDFLANLKNLFQLARTPFVKNIIGDGFDFDRIEMFVNTMIQDDVSFVQFAFFFLFFLTNPFHRTESFNRNTNNCQSDGMFFNRSIDGRFIRIGIGTTGV